MNDLLYMEDLDRYLSSDDSPEDCMRLSDMDGFLHGVICSPVAIPREEWLSLATGGCPKGVPTWVLYDIIDLFMGIEQDLVTVPPIVEPIFRQAKESPVIAMYWCEGFMKAVALRPKEWLRLTESGTEGHLLAPIVAHLRDCDGNSVLGIPQVELPEALSEATCAIPEAVAGIFTYWRYTAPTSKPESFGEL